MFVYLCVYVSVSLFVNLVPGYLARGIQGWSESISVCVFGCITVCVWVGVTLAVCGLLFVCVAIVVSVSE